MKKNNQVQLGSGNVFADLELEAAEALSVQAGLARLIYLRIEELGMTQAAAGERLGLKQPDVSKLMGGRHSGFSTERLLRILNSLGQDVQIVVKARPAGARGEGRTSVKAA